MGPEPPPSLREVQARFYDWVRGARPHRRTKWRPCSSAARDGSARARGRLRANVLRPHRGGPRRGLPETREARRRRCVSRAPWATTFGSELRRARCSSWAGAHLSQFVASHPLGARHPWLAGFAHLEWARFAAVDAPDSVRPSRGRPWSSTKRCSHTPLASSAAHAFVESGYAIHGLWPAAFGGQAAPAASAARFTASSLPPLGAER